MFEVDANTPFARPPRWATLQRELFETMSEALGRFVEGYFGEGYDPFWPPDDHVGVDGYDDVIEGFYNWPLVYAMGGDTLFLDHARGAYRGALDRCGETETPFGHPMVVDEFEQCRDWFHLGEGNLYTYNMGLAAPDDEVVVARAEQFASLYLPDSDVNNYDAEQRLVRAPMNGSMGPEYSDLSAFGTHSTFGGYGANYRWASHGLPWRDLEFDNATEFLDPANEERLYEIFDERCSSGDIPLNLGITSLMTNAYLHTGDDRYKEWVLEYLDAWKERTAENGGIIPDNVDRSGDIGGITGAWYGGMYGWSWGGWHYVGIGPTVAAENAVLLTGDREYLEFPRSQLDLLERNAIQRGDTPYLPHKYGSEGDYHYNGSGLRKNDGEILWRDGWYEFKPHSDDPYAVHLWYMSMTEADRQRLYRLGKGTKRDWCRVDPRPSSKHGDGHEYPWLVYLDGEYAEFPERIMEASHAHVQYRLDEMREEAFNPHDLTEDYLRNRNPIVHKGLLQLSMGAPQPVYYGGLVHAQVRHFDPDRGRPGLPPGVSALVTGITAEGIDLTLVNVGGRDRAVVVQAGAYGEHEFTAIHAAGESDEPGTNAIRVRVDAGSRVDLSANIERFYREPSYAFPWE